ncbi:MAG: cation transporter [Lachnospiraceae bacterium]|nr:cation transporter [Lachnospiraceae bacterium]
MGNVLTIAALVAIVAFAVYGTVKRIRFGSSCCGQKDPPDKKVKVQDRNKAHYPFRYVLGVDGMHCANCARRIENAFNRTEGRWAKADISKNEVELCSKQEEAEKTLSDIVSQAGYTMVSFTQS